MDRTDILGTAILGLTVLSVSFSVVGPKILGNATNLIFEGIIGKQLPAGLTQAQVEALLQAALGSGRSSGRSSAAFY